MSTVSPVMLIPTLLFLFVRVVTRADIQLRHTVHRTTGIFCTSAGLAGASGTNTNLWTSSGNQLWSRNTSPQTVLGYLPKLQGPGSEPCSVFDIKTKRDQQFYIWFDILLAEIKHRNCLFLLLWKGPGKLFACASSLHAKLNRALQLKLHN